MGRWSTVVFVAVTCAAPAAAADSNVRLEAGSEYDTNIHRLEVSDDQPLDAGPLARLGVRYRGSAQSGRDRAVATAYGGTKMFATGPGQSENALIVAAKGAYAHRLEGRNRHVQKRHLVVSKLGICTEPVEYYPKSLHPKSAHLKSSDRTDRG